MDTTILIATMNPRKRREVVMNLRRLDAKIVTPTEMGLHAAPTRKGTSYRDNAEMTAAAYCRLSGYITIAEDSGLEVDVLGGEPGLNSAHYAPGPRPTDAENQLYLLQLLSNCPRPWTALMHSSVVIADPTWGPVRFHYGDGEARGEIAQEPRGMNGFGYDALFYVPEFKHTLAEMDEADRYKVSARSNALRAAFKILEEIV